MTDLRVCDGERTLYYPGEPSVLIRKEGDRRGREGGMMLSQRSRHCEARSQEAEATAGCRER